MAHIRGVQFGREAGACLEFDFDFDFDFDWRLVLCLCC
jgi:hypothetical protein